MARSRRSCSGATISGPSTTAPAPCATSSSTRPAASPADTACASSTCAAGPGRLVAFEFNTEQVYLLVFSEGRIDVYRDGTKVAEISAPWTYTQLGQINWTQSADTLLVVHPDVAPKRITRTSESAWQLTDWTFQTENERIYWPHYKFADPAVTLQASATTGTRDADGIGAGLRCPRTSASACASTARKSRSRRCSSSTSARANVKETLRHHRRHRDWTEQAFSAARGWPSIGLLPPGPPGDRRIARPAEPAVAVASPPTCSTSISARASTTRRSNSPSSPIRSTRSGRSFPAGTSRSSRPAPNGWSPAIR